MPVIVVVSLFAACAKDIGGPEVAAIQQAVSGAPSVVNRDVWADVQRFYMTRSYAPAWIADEKQAAAALRVLRRAPEHGLPQADYVSADLPGLLTPEHKSIADAQGHDSAKLARLDIRVTAALLTLGRHVAIGRVDPASIDKRWKVRRTPPDLAASLAQWAAGSLDGWLDAVRPGHPEYAALQKALASQPPQVGSEADGADTARRIALNLERWRWMPDDLGERHILVNVPAFHMAVRDRGASVLDMKVIVGKQDRATPLFAAEMKEIVFSPYWNVPDSIAEGETAPAAARDPRFLARNNLEILRRGGRIDEIVDPASVDWNSPEAIKSLAFRQKPGAKNALGHVKFLMPNPYDVYLHDTPADSLFEREGRALSHGCVRLDQPEALATYLLRGNPEWTAAKIQTAMNQENEQHVALKEPLPVYVVYFTAWPRAGGGVDTWPDVYGYDARQARAH
ncbi:MAG TPA: L,D-transpeptidase family protein [Vicinamibacterales bacterium]|nr:L,D-transpeptidase family protein [Vicinamibacterales bacterium]